MDRDSLIKKLEYYLDVKNDCEAGSYPAEITEKVKEYEAKLQSEYDLTRKENLCKANHYIELLNELIAEIEEPKKEEKVEETTIEDLANAVPAPNPFEIQR